MPGSRIEQYRRWFDYEKDSHRKVIVSFETVPPDQRDSPSLQKAVDILAHLVAARRMWLFRLGVTTDQPGEIAPTGVKLGELMEQVKAMEQHWDDYLGRMTDDQLGQSFEYQSLDAGRFRSSIEDILTQLFGHSWYHRGQIASLVKAAGGQPAITDLIYWSREPLTDPAS